MRHQARQRRWWRTRPTSASVASTARGTARTRSRRSSPTGASSRSATCACPVSRTHGPPPACVDACPTFAITVEKVNVEERAGRSLRPGTPPTSRRPASRCRLPASPLPADVPVETYSGRAWSLRPEDPHWPLVWLTLLTQAATGASAHGHRHGRAHDRRGRRGGGAGRLAPAPRPARPRVEGPPQPPPLRLSREVALFGAYGGPRRAGGRGPDGRSRGGRSWRRRRVRQRPALHRARAARLALAAHDRPLLRHLRSPSARCSPATPPGRSWAIGDRSSLATDRQPASGSDEGRAIEWWGAVRLTLHWFRVPAVLAVVGWLAGAGLALAGADTRGAGAGRRRRADRALPLLRDRRAAGHARLVLPCVQEALMRSTVQGAVSSLLSSRRLGHGGERYTLRGRRPLRADERQPPARHLGADDLRLLLRRLRHAPRRAGRQGRGRARAIPDHPVNRGRLCPKGLTEHHTIGARRAA